MINFSTTSPVSTSPESTTGTAAARRIRRALRLLLEAKEYATRTQCSLWVFAVEIDLLREIGLTDNDLRFLVRSRHLEHAHDVTVVGQMDRKFRVAQGMAFDQHSCFVLTGRGARLASQVTARVKSTKFSGPSPSPILILPEQPSLQQQSVEGASIVAPDRVAGSPAIQQSLNTGSTAPPADRPVWNASMRTLFWDGQIVKCFRRRAVNQEIVLGAFQEESWPQRIDDPLSPQPCQDMKRRLNDTIKCLNRGQQHRLLRFRGDGTGEGVIWELVE